ncbi:MAG: malate/lactate/ureidoglycolate dehydrogenase [Betaproteobacteria bacterium]|nr:malate/lactate/ureidoglycolate dehydrogenase [Betaproteobacteria bacterium]NCV13761.1 malate/lactate/ureidoglycolate dehydrogenase [Betaproteobacteria bacterium]NCW80306.1 malate/lactate/ureidoglycolate dehydrogenase [Betaproteobacteria bacterium]NCY06417.1 malate/lactate/ureidoglycolate dehydrogenase [Betaproteobacteria bacterium]NDA91771.1 malate/lactate/ureidoglycolate dehydrogenase [Betaproteobacteria bacterium]
MLEFQIDPQSLEQWVEQLWRCAGSEDREARDTAHHLVLANLSGHDSHGVGMNDRYVASFLNQELRLNQRLSLAHDAGALFIADGQRGMGQSMARQAMDLGIDRARLHGHCIFGLRNSHHIGRIGHWAEMAAAQGLVAVHFTNAIGSPTMVAPFGGAQARFLTNPFTAAIPRPGQNPIIVDFASSAIAHGKVRVAYNKGVPVPEDCLIDAKGQPSDDPAVMFEANEEGGLGALLTFGGHKGYGLALVCELLGAALIGGESIHPLHFPKQYGIWNNMLVMLIDPGRLGQANYFAEELNRFVQWLTSAALSADSRMSPAQSSEAAAVAAKLYPERVLLPGEPEVAMREARAASIPIDATTLSQLDRCASRIEEALGTSPGPLSDFSAMSRSKS